MAKYTFGSRIRYSELGQDGQLALGSIVNYFQDCSTFQSEDIGLGLKTLEARQRAWMLSAWQLDISRYPALGEQVTIGTWAYGFNAMYGFRNFMLADEAGNYLVKANSQWFLYDLTAKRPMKLTPEDCAAYGEEEKLDMEYLPRKVPVPKEYEALPSFTIRRFHIDTNQHVNNGQYVQMALECIPAGLPIKRMRAEYKKAAVLGDLVVPRLTAHENGFTVVLSDALGAAYAVVELDTQR